MECERMIKGLNKPVSRLALGTAFYNLEKKEVWWEVLDLFVSCGGNAIDTARSYGESEEVIGGWMCARRNRQRIFLCTKGGLSEGVLPRKRLRETIHQELAQSLRRLQTDYVDLYYLHRDNPSLSVGEIVESLNELVERGLARALGASNWEYPRIDEANEFAEKHNLRGFVAVSNNLSLAVPAEPFYEGLVTTDTAGVEWHRRTGIPLFSWSAQARGFFTGRFRRELLRDARRRGDFFTARMIEVYCTDENIERLSRARRLAEEKGGYSAVQVALAWLLHQPLKVVPIIGPRTPQELLSSVEALSIRLTERQARYLNLQS